MSSRYLDYEVALLLAKYGKSALLNALAKKLDLSPKEIDALLEEMPRARPSVSSRRRPSLVDAVDQVIQEHPTKAALLRTLCDRFENRAFLSELRDVRKFFEQHSQSFGSTKSRAESLPRLLRLLAEFDLAELDALCQAAPQGTYSSLGMISDEILRQHK